MKKKLLYIVGGLVVSLGIGGGAYSFGIMKSGNAPAEEIAEAPVVEEELEAIFYNLPPLVVSSQYNGSLRYLQVKLSILTRSEETRLKLENNTPLIQNSLLMLLDTFSFAELEHPDGKEVLRKKAEEDVRRLIKDEGVESVLFTGFVIQ